MTTGDRRRFVGDAAGPGGRGGGVIHDVFVYGTLMPGHLRWRLVADRVTEQWQDVVVGQLYDTGRGYPGARFDRPGRIPGWGLRLEATSCAETLELLDEVEGPELFARVRVEMSVGRPAWSYELRADPAGLDPITAWTGVEQA